MTVVDAAELSPAQIVTLLQSDRITVDAGLELLDSNDDLIEDITADLDPVGSSVERGIYRSIHGTCRLKVARQLNWGSQRVRPYLLVSAGPELELLTDDDDVLLTTDGGALLAGDDLSEVFFRWDLGVFLLNTPVRPLGESVVTFEVEGFDKLDILNTEYGETFTAGAGLSPLAVVAQLITDAGETRIAIDQAAASVVLPADVAYSLGDNYTTLGIINDLLRAVGYRALFVDRAGVYRSEPYRSSTELAPVWTYNPSDPRTTVAEDRQITEDYYRAANIIVGVNDDPDKGLPIDGDGRYVAINQADGKTSIEGRGGRVIRRVERGRYANQAALRTAIDRMLEVEKRVTEVVDLNASPNPVHGHFDVVQYVDAAVPTSGRYLVTDWSLPLDGSDMALSLRGV